MMSELQFFHIVSSTSVRTFSAPSCLFLSVHHLKAPAPLRSLLSSFDWRFDDDILLFLTQ